jgi:hypothetical protein
MVGCWEPRTPRDAVVEQWAEGYVARPGYLPAAPRFPKPLRLELYGWGRREVRDLDRRMESLRSTGREGGAS